jgi:branched-chain amino acid transport system permease protein
MLPTDPFFIGEAVITPADHDPGGHRRLAGGADLDRQLHQLGRAMRAGREPARGRADGSKPDFIISATFAIGAILAAIAGVMYALQLRHGAAHRASCRA